MLQITFYPVTSVVTGLQYGSALEQFLTTQLSYLIPNAATHPDVVSKKWDGRISVMQRYYPHTNTHTLPTGIVKRLVECLKLYNIPCSFMSAVPALLPDPELANLQNNQSLILRPYQFGALYKAVSGYELAGYGIKHPRTGGIQHICTGGGKSPLAAKIVQSLQNKAVILVQSGDLLEQMYDGLVAALGEEFIGYLGDGDCELKAINVCMVQSLHKFYKSKTEVPDPTKPPTTRKPFKWDAEVVQLIQQTKVVIFDEVHGVAAKQPFEVLSMFQNVAHVTGLSASPWRDDGTGILIECACGPIVEHIPATLLIAQGWLVPPTIITHELPAPVGASEFGDYDYAYATYIVNNHKRHNYIANLANNHLANDEVVLVLVKLKEHGNELQRRIPGSMFVDGKITKKKRKKIWQAVRDGEVKCIIATSLADQGLDIPNLDVLILAGAGASTTRALQRVGRVVRTTNGINRLLPTYKGKQMAYVHVMADKHPILKAHVARCLAIYMTEPGFKYQTVVVPAY